MTLTFPSWEPQLCRPGLCSTTHWYSIPRPCTARVLLQSWGGEVASEEGSGCSCKKDAIFPPAHRLLPWGILRWASEKGRSRHTIAGLACYTAKQELLPAQKEQVPKGIHRQDWCILEVVSSQERARVERRHSRHTTQRLAALLPLRATANPPSPAALPGAGFSGGRRGGAAGRRENSITLPVCVICLLPFLGQGLAKQSQGTSGGPGQFHHTRDQERGP